MLYLLADPAPKTTNRQQAQQDVQYELDGLVRDEQKVFDAMDADETGRYLPFGYRNGVPSPGQKDKRADIAKLNRWWPGQAGTPASGATTALSAATRPASASGHWKPRPNPLSRKRLRTRRKVSRHE